MQNRQEFDTIIIGSGAGGLSAAICLARAGQSVVVLEQHDVPGGWCHSFYLHGHRFSPGVHYIGQLGKGQSTTELYESLGVANDLVFFKMNPKAYEHCYIGDEHIDIPADFEELISTLSKRFPKEKKNISDYLHMVRNVSEQLQLIPKMNGFWDNITIPWRTRHMGKYGLFSLRRVIGWYIKDPLLKNMLNLQCGDHGLPPARVSFPLHCAVMDHYSNGGYYPMGGGAAIVKAMTRAIKKHDGEVLTRQNVKKILVKGDKKKRAIGVELYSGEQLFAKRIISNADPGKTYLQLIGKNHLSKSLIKKLEKTRYSCTSLMLFLTVDMDVRKVGMDSGNIWIYPNRDMDEYFEEMMATDILSGEFFQGMFISCTTIKDPTSFDGRHHCIEAITYINYDAFEKYENEKTTRSSAYLEFKEKITKKMIRTLEKSIPGISKHIVHQSLGTPITNEYYINVTKGSVYGTEKTLGQIGPFAFQAQSEIDNLYLCGSSILSHGVAGASYSGIQTAAKILGCNALDLMKPTPDQNIRTYDAEDISHLPEWIKKKIEMRKSKFDQNEVIVDSKE